MREIKFRAWHKELQLMASFQHCYFDFGIEMWQLQEANNGCEVSVMQFTGLHDKNGVEIYEGDIVKWDDMSNGRYWRVAVVDMSLDAGGLGFTCFDCPTIPNSSAHGHTFKYGSFIYTDTENHLEVIGNIHQDPELLELAQ